MDTRLLGIDEAGRGPLAGPLVVAGVIWKKEIDFRVADSKTLSPKRREQLAVRILENSWNSIKVIDVDYLNQYKLSVSLAEAIREILIDLEELCDEVLFDGKWNPFQSNPYFKTMIGADAKISEVSAASILAKTTRDRMMIQLDEKYPQYGFKRHKGYYCKEHIEALKKHGISPVHRTFYKPILEITKNTYR
jgi:ribonuclease HII